MMRKLLGFFGIGLGEGRVLPVRLGGRFLRCLCVGALVMIGGGGVFFWQSSKSWFCNTCHIMGPYVASWRESTHGKEGVECVQCHFPPGFVNSVLGKLKSSAKLIKYITGTYGTVRHAEIEDASCMRPGCHEKRLLEGKVEFKGVQFDHKPHLTELRRGKRLRCQTCHSQIVQGTHMTVTESVCITCHFKGFDPARLEEPVGGCLGCHELPSKPVKLVTGDEYDHAERQKRGVSCLTCHSDTVQGNGEVPKQVCIACHAEQERLEKFDDHDFMHQTHVTDHKVECFYCHSEIRHGRDVNPQEGVAECTQCHQRTHLYTAQLYRGTGARGVENKPGGTAAVGVRCRGCHKVLTPAEGDAPHSTYKAGEKACMSCHGDEVEGMLVTWKEDMAEALKEATADVAKAKAALKELKAPELQREATRLIDDARRNLALVRHGKGVHNFEYALEALEAASSSAAKVLKLVKEK